MTLRDLRVILNLGLAAAIVREYGRSEYWRGKRDAWQEANAMIVDHRTRYDPKPVSAAEESRRRRWFGVA